VGLLLIVLPWSAFWEENYFAQAWPPLHPIFINNFVRGGITGLGFVNLVAAGSELLSLFSVRHRSQTPLGGPADEAESYANGTDARAEP
jgi:hypothetical protein